MINPIHVNVEAESVACSSPIINQSSQLSYALQSSNPHFQELLQLAETVAKSRATVLIQGDSGSGKNILARFLFQRSQRNQRPYLIFKCKETPVGHQDSELKNLIQQALGGTLLLTDITYLGSMAQVRLLRAIQDGLDLRLMVTTSRSLPHSVKLGEFREDLYYRLNGVTLKIPSLVERLGDIELLARNFVERWAKNHQRAVSRISAEAIQLLNAHRWPGNIRELEGVIERAVLLAQTEEIRAKDIQFQNESRTVNLAEPNAVWKPGKTLDEIERTAILEALKYHQGNRTHAAKSLGISIRTLRNKLAEYRVMGISA